jgi:hypothetical protein
LSNLINQQDARFRRVLQRAHERTLNEEVRGVEPAPNEFPIRTELVRLCFQKELLQGSVELSNGLLFVDSRIALKSFHDIVKSKCQGLRKLRLATTGRRQPVGSLHVPIETGHADALR